MINTFNRNTARIGRYLEEKKRKNDHVQNIIIIILQKL